MYNFIAFIPIIIMTLFKLKIDNNFLAVLAIILIITSIFNFFLAINVINASQIPTADLSAMGQVSLCSSPPPDITADSYHQVDEYSPFYYDVNATGEGGSQVNFSDDTGLFDIGQYTGVINFTPDNDDVGMYNITITTLETTCNTLQDSKLLTFNVTNWNEAPELISLFFTNESSNGTNATYYFPIANPVELYESVQYTVAIIAQDPDTIYGDIITYFAVWTEIANLTELFTPNSTGGAQFKPVRDEVGNYTVEFYVTDTVGESDGPEVVKMIVINVNAPPVLENKSVLMAQTAQSGEPFYLDVNGTDADNDTLVFNITFINCTKTFNVSDQNCSIFSMDQYTGVIDFTPRIFDVGNYSVNYTLYDGEELDWMNGTFTVVEYANHPPNITDWTPKPYDVTMDEGEGKTFNITVYDPDSGWQTSGISWYINGVEEIGQNEYNYTFQAGPSSSGVYNITVVASDGNLTDSHQWRLVVFDTIKVSIPPGPSGGQLGTAPCIENWRCTSWSECSREGIQIKVCMDLAKCNTTVNKPEDLRNCIYTPSPDCYDGITNCHDGHCEILTDCGGPCPSCPTCSDGIRNCHVSGECEESADCGGPCRPCVVPPQVAVCGNNVCEAGELYGCMEDCAEFWIDGAIFMLIIILLIVVSILLYVYRKETVLLYIYRRMGGK